MEKSKEIQHVTNALKANGYPSSIISNILKNKKKRPTQTIPTPEELVGMFLSGPIQHGILEEGHLWKRFFTSRGLEQYLERYTSTTYTHDFNFCILLCVRKDRTGFIEQLLTFPFVQKKQVLISLAFLISMASLNRSQDYFVVMEFESSLNLTEHYNKNFLHQNSGHPLISKPTLFTRSHIPIALGITSVKRVDVC